MHAQACNTVVLHATQSSCTHRRHAWFLLLAAAKLRLKGGNLCSARSGVQHERLARFVKMTMMRAQRPLSPYAGAAAVVRMRPRKEHNPSIYHLNDFRRFPQRDAMAPIATLAPSQERKLQCQQQATRFFFFFFNNS